MKQLGVKSVGIGLESGNDDVLGYYKGGSVNVNSHHVAIDLIHRHGFTLYGSFIIGAPAETKAQIDDTYSLADHPWIDFVDVNLLTPFPGTDVWDQAIRRGLVSYGMNWNALGTTKVLMSETLTAKQIKRQLRRFGRLRMKKRIKNIARHPKIKYQIG